MFTLVSDRSKYFRVKRGESAARIEKELSFPLSGEVFAGRIIEVKEPMTVYTVKPAESYAVISEKTGTAEEELKKINNFKPLYPSCKLFVPCKK